jgi:hypothetical protein
MVRKLKYHEEKLLKKVDFHRKAPGELRYAEVVRRYNISRPADYHSYNRLCGVRSFSILPFPLLLPFPVCSLQEVRQNFNFTS